jgi:ribokinase
VDTSFVGRAEGPTGLAVVMVDDQGENAITVVPGANALLTAADVDDAVDRLARGGVSRAVVLAGLEVPPEAVERAARLAGEHGWPFVLNPSPVRALPPGLLAACDVLVPNEHEARQLHPSGAAGLLAAGARTVLVTLGARGAEIHRPGEPPVHHPAVTVEAVDTTGAGDAFAGTLAWALAEGHPLNHAVRLALAGGALATRAVGARSGLGTADDVLARAAGSGPGR